MFQYRNTRSHWIGAVVALICIIGIGHQVALAAETGKLSGRVLDKKTGEPLMFCPVQVLGTTIGATTDVDGRYTILAVPPGEHSVQAQMVGYTSMVFRKVLVKPDQTTPVNFELEASAIEMPTIEVIRTTDMIQMDQATTKRDVTAEKIKTMPVVNVGDILKTVAGVSVRNDRFHIRGGRSTELIYNVDGVSMTDPLGGRGPTQALNLSGTEIENISIVKGAWSPEYGGTSGIINVSTKSGDRNVTRGHIEYFTDNFGTANLNNYSRNFNRLEFTLGGPEPLFTGKLLPALGLDDQANKLSYFISLDFNRTDSYTPINDFTSPSTRMSFRETEFLGFNISDRQQNSGNLLAKLTYRVSPDIRVTGQFKKTYERNMRWRWAYRYTANTIPWEEDENDAYSLRLTHNLGPSTYYEILLSRFERTYWQRPGDPTTPGGTMSPDDFLFTWDSDQFQDVNNNGLWDEPEAWTDIYPDGEFNFGDVYLDRDGNGVWTEGIDTLIFDFNRNGRYDFDTGEPFEDPNGNGVYDPGDILLRDGNGNGTYDPERDIGLFANDDRPGDGNDQPEPFIDGDISLGEPFTDVNRNGIYDGEGIIPGFPQGEPFEDLSHDGKYQTSEDPWVPGVPFRDLNGNRIFDRGSTTPSGSWSSSDADYDLGEPFLDVNGNGQRDAEEGFYDRGWDGNAIWHERNPITTTLKVDLVSQMRREHELKVGATYSAYDLKFSEILKPYASLTSQGSYVLWQELQRQGFSDEEIESIFLNDVGDTLFAQSLDEPFPGRGSIRDFYRQKPSTGAFYIVDKMEYGQMVAQVGFRYEYFIQSNDAGGDPVFVDSAGFKLVDYRDRFAPRIAFSYPISDKAKVFFNYGHFYQLPQLNQMYRRSTFSSSETGTIGNVNLDFKKTIKYEFGLQYMLSSEYLLSIQGFYTDDFGRVSESEELGVSGLEATTFYENSDYSRARGLELELEKRYGNYVSGSVTYDFSYAFGKSSAEALDYFENFYALTGGGFRIQEFPLDWDERHTVTFILDIRVPSNDHPRLFGFKLPDKWGLNIFWQYGSGFPYTPSRDHPGVSELLVGRLDPEPNSQRLPVHNNVDLRFNKDFTVGPMNYTFEIWVYNLFDERAINEVNPATGRPESDNNFNTIVYAPDDQANPRLWAPSRQIRLGFGVNF